MTNKKMFCFQCSETANNEGCDFRGVCGKPPETANLQDLLIHVLKGISLHVEILHKSGETPPEKFGRFVSKALFSTVTNVNFDAEYFQQKIEQGLNLRDEARKLRQDTCCDSLPDAARWSPENGLGEKAAEVGVLQTEDENIRSLRELLTYGVKGIAAYAYHAAVLGKEDPDIYSFMMKSLAATTDDSLGVEDLVGLNLEAGEVAVNTMALLDEANTDAYGHPEPTEVSCEVGDRPGILVSGHDLKDLEELLKQTEGTGVDIYTHGEMLPAQAYPKFKKYEHFAGNYGGTWPQQITEFEKFNGPILMTTNCLVPPEDSYKDRVYTTGPVGFPGLTHIPKSCCDDGKNFSQIIEHARQCSPPEQLEQGSVTTGFAHNALLAAADDVVEAIKEGHIRRFIVMAGCDGRHSDRDYYTEVAKNLPEDAVILTAGCAKYRYNKLDLGDIGGIPRVLDAGQCNDSYSLVVVAQKLAEVFEMDDINELPISFDIAWYEQKAVAVLLALLHLGVKGIRLGPTLPAFVSPDVLQVLVDEFDMKPIGEVDEDVEAMMAGQ